LQSQRKTKLFLIPKAFGTNASKKIKNATHSRHSMALKLNTDNGLQGNPPANYILLLDKKFSMRLFSPVLREERMIL